MNHFVQKAYRQIFQLFSANMIRALFGFVGTIFVLRGWSSKDIGDIYTLVGVMLIFQQFGDLGTGSSFIQLLSRSKKESTAMIETYLGFKLFVFVILFAFFLLTAGYNFFVEASREVFGLAAVTLAALFSIYGGFFTALITARQNFNKLAVMKIAPPALKTLLLIALYFSGFNNFNWLLIAFVVPAFTLFFVGFTITGFPIYKHAFKLKQIFTRTGNQLYQMSKWVFLLNFAQTSFSQIDIFMLKRMSSDYQIAQFVSASRLAVIVFMFSQAIFTVMLPKMRSFKTNAELLLLSKKIFQLYMGLLVLMIPVIFVAPYIIPLIMGPKYVASIPIFQVYVFQAIGHMFIHSQSLVFYRKNLLPWFTLFSFVQLGLNFVGNYLVIYQYKALGAVWVSTILNNLFYFVCLAFSTYMLMRKKDEDMSS